MRKHILRINHLNLLQNQTCAAAGIYALIVGIDDNCVNIYVSAVGNDGERMTVDFYRIFVFLTY